MRLSNIIIDRIKKEGPISFRDFMDMCLYYPGLGYYTSSSNPIGMTGDFYTSSNVSPVFGKLLAKQLDQMWDFLGEPEFTIVEIGAGTGRLSKDVLAYFSNDESKYERLNFYIVEKNTSVFLVEQSAAGQKIK